MSKKPIERKSVNPEITWDLTPMFKDESAFSEAIDAIVSDINTFNKTYAGTLSTAEKIYPALVDLEGIQERLGHISTYASLLASQDQTDFENTKLKGLFMMKVGPEFPKLNFVTQELKALDEQTLLQLKEGNPTYARYFETLIKNIPHTPSKDVEDALTLLKGTFSAPYSTYEINKLVDMEFEPFSAKGIEYANSYGLFEDEWEVDNDLEVRHNAFDSFYGGLAKHQNTVASIYETHVLTEKSLGKIHGFKDTIDSLLFEQEVTRDMYDRQIDLIKTHLAPHMRKYAKLLKRVHKLDKMTYKDLKLVVDPEFEPAITIEKSKEQLNDALSCMGDDYIETVNRAFDERWIDFPQNKGKSTGAFCSSPYGKHPYILISWTERMNELFVLAHELGHAGHFYLAGKNQTIFNTRPSLYLIEAPSTMNELIMVNYLKKNATDDRMKRWVLSTIISRTYYHNFVTHLLEAAYQREVYLHIDNNKPLSANVLNSIKRKVLEDFWGDEVEISPNSELTWMRQPHYYMGLYPYTYSAGLTLATVVNEKVENNELEIERWKEVLKAGGTKSPLDLAKMVDVDLSTEAPLLKTIEIIGRYIDEIIELTDKIEQES